MELIIDSNELQNTFLNLQDKYQKYYWLTAWAGDNSKVLSKLIASKNKIGKIVVGIHFYQTHPNFIKEFSQNSNVRYIMQPEGTFHPKLYLFYNNENEWEIIIGSANFTKSAFTINTEACTWIKSTDKCSSKILTQSLQLIDYAWSTSRQFNNEEFATYTSIWDSNKNKINRLSGKYANTNSNKINKPIFLIPIIRMEWNTFVKRVYKEGGASIKSRLEVLKISRDLFKKYGSFENMGENERKFIAGIPNTLHVKEYVNWAFFGSMQGAGWFKKKIIQNDEKISKALDQIPLDGLITKKHYNSFLDYYKESIDGVKLATATRLLTMKRPDVFICLDSKNKKNLCNDFQIKVTKWDYDRYWEDIISRIYDSEWWKNPSPRNQKEQNISNARVAFLDSLYYEY